MKPIADKPSFDIEDHNEVTVVTLGGHWTALTIHQLAKKLEHISFTHQKLVLNCQNIKELDTAGALLIHRLGQRLTHEGKEVSFQGLKPGHKTIFKLLMKHEIEEPPQELKQPFPLYFFEWAGRQAYAAKDDLHQLLQFIGELTLSLWSAIRHPRLFRLRTTVHHLEKVGLNALPIVGLISFLIGVVLVYQGAYQLKRFGAEIFTVDLLAVSAMREIGILLTAIVVAGRSGSAFTAQIGFMKLNQEIDAMCVLGLNPFHVLVIPRLIALLIALPLLAFYADIMALLGGGVMCMSLIDLAFDQFIHHLQLAIKPWTFWTGMIKAPIFALAIAIIGCFEGMRVHGGADHVGTQTTRSVVESIFLVIVLDAAFSVLYSYIGI